MPQAGRARITLTCVSNPVGGKYVGNATWLGVPVRDLLEEAGVKDGADAVKSTSADNMTIGTPLPALTDPERDAIIAIGMNGEPLPLEPRLPGPDGRARASTATSRRPSGSSTSRSPGSPTSRRTGRRAATP